MTSQNAAYTLRTLLDDIPLSEDPDAPNDVYITTVDVWEGNLYVGTSAAEILHFVSIPGAQPVDEPSWILASRQQPPFTNEQAGAERGVRQILILPGAGKACVLCNATLTFFTLPELSPAYGGRIKQAGCNWIGGLDLSEQSDDVSDPVIVICLRQRLRLIKIGEEARKIRDIELAGIGAIQRRGDLACVADTSMYRLLDVVNQRVNQLFPVSATASVQATSQPQELLPRHPSRQQNRSISGTSPMRLGRGHERNTSINSVLSDRLRPDGSPHSAQSSLQSGDRTPKRAVSPSAEDPTTLPPPPPAKDDAPQLLPPNIVSPADDQFLLTTGTRYEEPGVGLFVNLDGDVVRGTIEFTTYPDALVLDHDQGPEATSDGLTEPFVLALVRKTVEGSVQSVIELQCLHEDPAEVLRSRQQLELPPLTRQPETGGPVFGVGLRTATTRTSMNTSGTSITLRQRMLHLEDSAQLDAAEARRNDEEDKLAARYATVSSRVLVFNGARVSWAVQTSIVTRLTVDLEEAVAVSNSNLVIDTTRVQYVLNSIRGQQATNELEFVTLAYIRQRGALLLCGHLLLQSYLGTNISLPHQTAVSAALEESDLDPRVLLSLLPALHPDVTIGQQGLWLPQGLLDTVLLLKQQFSKYESAPAAGLHLLKVYLLYWRKRKGFGSVADEESVFRSVDAALLHIYLILDEHSPKGAASAGSIRAELNELVDRGVDCFDRAVQLFEQYHRIYMLSRLYQSRKLSAQVLASWRRILDGEHDAGGELIDGWSDVRRYLSKLRDKEVVTEYGSWLASKNPKLGVQVFADSSARVTFTPAEAVEVLKERAPGAVKDFLEYLVFGKNHVQYVNDLISFYLSTILSKLTDPTSDATDILLQSTQTYRALQPPKPTFSDFITDNAVPAEWWSNRLRLLQLIGGSHGAASRYDVHALRTQLEPHSNALVPEMIILNGREGKHEAAIHLLVAGLGDYDTAVRYCLLGGSSIFHPSSSTASHLPPVPSKEEQSRLFQHLLNEFLAITDEFERLERASELLERFGSWFDISQVLELVPLEWSIDEISAFIVSSLRHLLQEKNETTIAKALAGAQNLRTSALVAEKLDGLAPVVETQPIISDT